VNEYAIPKLTSFTVNFKSVQSQIIHCTESIEIRSFIERYLINSSTDQATVLCDTNTGLFFSENSGINLKELQIGSRFIVPAGEEHKNIFTITKVLEFFSQSMKTRDSLLVNVGGGVVSDLGGFAASVYKRGIRYINVPTTLLSMVDAAIGGKTGVNLGHIKNQIGTFHFPLAVLIWPGFLKTLPEREWGSGKGELLKYSLLGAGFSPEEIAAGNDPDAFGQLIRKSVAFKTKIVAMDPEDSGIRMILNFGHTIGHALESEALRINIPITHGEAVAAGIIAEMHLLQHSELMEDLMEKTLHTYHRLFDPAPVRNILEGDPSEWILHDKKGKGNTILLPVIPFNGSSIQTCPLTADQIAEGFTFLRRYL